MPPAEAASAVGFSYLMPPPLHHLRSPLIYGGSFDPPQAAHLTLPRLARDAVAADSILYIPAYRSPFKADQPPGASPADRLAMLRLATADDPDSLVLDDEIRRGDAATLTPIPATAAASTALSYTVDTLEALQKRLHPDATMRLLIGTDQLVGLPRWHRSHRIVELAPPVVMVRAPSTHAAARTWLDEQAPPWLRDARLTLLDLPPMDISATVIRQRLAHNQPIADLVPPPVEQYIQQNHLYQPTNPLTD